LSRTQKNETRGIFGVTEEKSRHAKVAYIFAGGAQMSRGLVHRKYPGSNLAFERA
jgi:hypothetical protein